MSQFAFSQVTRRKNYRPNAKQVPDNNVVPSIRQYSRTGKKNQKIKCNKNQNKKPHRDIPTRENKKDQKQKNTPINIKPFFLTKQNPLTFVIS